MVSAFSSYKQNPNLTDFSYHCDELWQCSAIQAISMQEFGLMGKDKKTTVGEEVRQKVDELGYEI